MGASEQSAPFLMLSALYTDDVMVALWSEHATVESWLKVEASLALAQAKHGVITAETAKALRAALVMQRIDLQRLWSDTRNVGYPILPLIRQVSDGLPDEVAGRLHFGATTQDIMDTGLALQLKQSLTRLRQLVTDIGDSLLRMARVHSSTVMAARTHNQQAVPTTLGAKWAVYVDELGRQLERLDQLEPRVCRISLFGAGGTSAALGPTSVAVREEMARDLGLVDAAIPWHASRDGLAEYVAVVASLAHSVARLAREIANLSRTEIGEILEPGGHHRGASSTMPQKANPIGSEAVIGLTNLVRGLLTPAFAAMVLEHERAAGEWQIEWDALPRASCLTAAALALMAGLLPDLRVNPEMMTANMSRDGGLVMAEAYMIRLAGPLGRGHAHDVVYESASRSRETGKSMQAILKDLVPPAAWAESTLEGPIDPQSYLGEARRQVDMAETIWARRSKRESS